jgi:SAM-dependent methyltransferase
VGDLSRYFVASRNLGLLDDWLLSRCLGDTLDVGAGPGRLAVALRERDPDRRVIALDTSPGALAVARARGVRDTVLHDIRSDLPLCGDFDSVLLGGHNLGLLCDKETAVLVLNKLDGVLRPGGRILGTAGYPGQLPSITRTANRATGRLQGHVRMRVRFQNLATDWFDYAFLSLRDLSGLLAGTNWRIEDASRDQRSWSAHLVRRSPRDKPTS